MIFRGDGDLLKTPADALVNTVNTVGVMGKGIALQFKLAFPDLSLIHISVERESFNRLVAEGEHIMNAEIALFRAGIAFLQLPFQQNKFASNLFMVLNVSKAKACLLRAGFQPKVDSETVLFDSRNGQAVQLLQGKYGRPRAER